KPNTNTASSWQQTSSPGATMRSCWPWPTGNSSNSAPSGSAPWASPAACCSMSSKCCRASPSTTVYERKEPSMRVLVTGAAGFIGSALSARLLARGDEVLGYDNLNAYYDPSLKEARLARLLPQPGFGF